MGVADSQAEAGGYSWSGNLAQTEVRSLYDRLADLRLSGMLEISDGDKRAEVAFVGGDPVETRGSNTREVKSWRQGSFKVTQRVPDLAGALTDGLQLAGGLLETRAKELIRHCEDAKLTADLELERPTGERALVRFAHGHVEKTEVNGKPELSALAMIDGWLDGRYVLSLRPLFAEDAPRTPPPQMRGPAPGQLFDFTAPVRLDSEEIAVIGPSSDAVPKATADAPTAPANIQDAARQMVDSHDGETAEHKPIPSERTAITKPLPPPSQGRVVPPSRAVRTADPDATSMVKNPTPRRRWPVILLGAFLGIVVLGVASIFLLPRFGVKLPFKLFADAPTDTGKVTVTPAPIVDDSPVKTPVTKDKDKDKDKPAVKDKSSSVKDKSPVVKDKTSAPVERPEAEQKLIDKGRKLLVDGHSHSALDIFKGAHRLVQKDPLLDQLEKMAQGKTGRGELILDGSGSFVIDGKSFKGGKKLKLPAGPHALGEGADATEFILGKGEKKHLKAGG
jgi:hypothetical protein